MATNNERVNNMDTYYVELIQTDPDDAPTPGCAHICGELDGFPTASEALSAGIARLGTLPGEEFYPCCDWQSPRTQITSVIVYAEGPNGERDDANPIQAHLKASA